MRIPRICFLSLILGIAVLGRAEVFAHVTANILTRVFLIRHGELVGSLFTIEKDGRGYLITARHLLMGAADGESIDLFREGRWSAYVIKGLPIEPLEADVAVLALSSVLPQTLPIDFSDTITLSEELYFLGFPYGLSIPGIVQSSGFHLPFVKRGIISAMGQVNGVSYVFLDGRNNPGFSGGPIIHNYPDNRPPTIVAVVTGFRHADEPIRKEGKETEYLYRANTGIVIGVGINHTLEAIAKRPIGPLLGSQ